TDARQCTVRASRFENSVREWIDERIRPSQTCAVAARGRRETIERGSMRRALRKSRSCAVLCGRLIVDATTGTNDGILLLAPSHTQTRCEVAIVGVIDSFGLAVDAREQKAAIDRRRGSRIRIFGICLIIVGFRFVPSRDDLVTERTLDREVEAAIQAIE